LFGSYAVTEEDKADNLVSEILYEWNRMGKTVTPSELERAKVFVPLFLLLSIPYLYFLIHPFLGEIEESIFVTVGWNNGDS
jgi:hypothetical protein